MHEYLSIKSNINLGMYQEEHGIVHNSFYDRELNKTITMSRYLK